MDNKLHNKTDGEATDCGLPAMEGAELLLTLADLRAEKERFERIAAIKQANGINFYRPHYKQHLFHKAQAIGRYLRTGNRFGKSDCGAAETVAWLLGERPWYKEVFDILDGEGRVVERHEGHPNHPLVTAGIPSRPLKGLLIVVDWDMAQKIFTQQEGSYETWGKLFKLLPKHTIGNVHRSRGGHIDQIEVLRPDGGKSVLFIDTIESYKHNKLGAESMDWDFIHVDEPCPESMFKAHARGLMDRNGWYWFTCTPLDEMWINTHFTPNAQRLVAEANDGLLFTKGSNADVTRYIVTGSLLDNPYRTAAGVANFEASLTREEVACRLHGLPLAMAGLVYKEFEYDQHVMQKVPAGWESFSKPPRDYTIRLWWDFHTRLPQAVLFFATAPDGRVFLYDELFVENLIEPVALSIVEKTRDYFVAQQEIDPFALIPNPVDGTSVQDTLANYGLWFNPATKDKRRGINLARQLLKQRGPDGNPVVLISPECERTLFEFSHYVYDLKKQEPKDEDDHMMENFYRGVLSGLGYVSQAGDLPERRELRIGTNEYAS